MSANTWQKAKPALRAAQGLFISLMKQAKNERCSLPFSKSKEIGTDKCINRRHAGGNTENSIYLSQNIYTIKRHITKMLW